MRFVDAVNDGLRKQDEFFERAEKAGNTVFETRTVLHNLAKRRESLGFRFQARVLRLAARFIRA